MGNNVTTHSSIVPSHPPPQHDDDLDCKVDFRRSPRILLHSPLFYAAHRVVDSRAPATRLAKLLNGAAQLSAYEVETLCTTAAACGRCTCLRLLVAFARRKKIDLRLRAADTAASLHGQVECAQFLQKVLWPQSRAGLRQQQFAERLGIDYGAFMADPWRGGDYEDDEDAATVVVR